MLLTLNIKNGAQLLDYELISHNICIQGFHIIDNFLPLDDYLSLRDIAKNQYQQGMFRGAKIGLQQESHSNQAIRTDQILWLEEHSNIPAIQNYVQQTQNLSQAFNHTLFLGLKEFEMHFAVYQPGAFYKKHIDQFAKKKTRMISFVYYLNEHWQDDQGGELILYNTDEELLHNVSPLGNRFICFNSVLPHEVKMTKMLRYSITGWMKRAS